MPYEKTVLAHKVTELDSKLAALSDDSLSGILNGIIHRPGWTTPVEGGLVLAAVDALHAQADGIRAHYLKLIEIADQIGK